MRIHDLPETTEPPRSPRVETSTPRTSLYDLPDAGTIPAPQSAGTASRVSAYNRLISMAEDPEEQDARIRSTIYLAERLQESPEWVWRNWDIATESYFGGKTDPKSAGQVIMDSLRRGWGQYELGVDASGIMVDVALGRGMDEERLVALLERQSQLPPPDNAERWLLTQGLAAAGEQVPRMVASMGRGAVVGGAAAGAAFVTSGALNLGAILFPEATTSAAGLAAVKGATVSAFSKGMKVGTISSLAQMYAGSTFLEIMALEDESGNRIDPRIAVASSAGAGILAAMTELWSWKQIPGASEIVEAVSGQALRNVLARNAFQDVALNALARWGMGIGAGVVNEIAQESAQVAMVELARVLDEGDWDPYTAAEVRERMEQITRQSALSYGTMGLPGTFINMVTNQQARAAREVPQADIPQATQEAQEATGAQERAEPMAGVPEGVVEALEVEERAIRDAMAKESPTVADAQRALDAAEQIDRLEAAQRAQGVDRSPRAPWRMTSAEYDGSGPAAWMHGTFAQEMQAEIRQAAPHLTDAEIEAGVYVSGLAAALQGVDPVEWFQDPRRNLAFVDPTHPGRLGEIQAGEMRGATQFLQDGRALIHLAEIADGTTLIHEGAHVIRRALPQDILADAENHYGVAEGMWTRDQEEAFAKDGERYFATGQAPTEGLRALFERIAEVFRDIYEFLRGSDEIILSDGARRIFDSIVERAEQNEQARVAQGQQGEIITLNLRGRKPGETPGMVAQDRDGPLTFWQATFHGTPHLFEAEPGFPHGRSRLDKIALLERNKEALDQVLFQSPREDHQRIVERAVLAGQYVPDNVLQEYQTEAWAAAEIEARKEILQEAESFATLQEFIEYYDVMGAEIKSDEYLQTIYERAHAKAADPASPSRAAANQRWVSRLDKASLSGALLDAILQDNLDALGNPLLESAAKRLKKGEAISDAHYKKIMDQIKDDPARYRSALAIATQDSEEMAQIQLEAALDPTGTEIEELRERNRKLRAQNKTLDRTVEGVSGRLASTQAALQDYRQRHQELLQEIRDHEEWLREYARDVRQEAAQDKQEATAGRDEALKSARAEARKSESEMKKRLLAEMREKIRSATQETRLLAEYRARSERLIRRIMEKPSGAIDYEYARRIQEVQSSFRVGTPQRISEIQQFISSILQDTNINDQQKEILQHELARRDLKRMTPQELEEVSAQMEALRSKGRAVRAEKIAVEKALRWQAVLDVTDSITNGKGVEAMVALGSQERRQEMKKGRIPKAFLHTLRPERLWRLMDGGEPGAVYRWLGEAVNEQTDEQLRMTDQRITAGEEQMEALGITGRMLAEPVSAKLPEKGSWIVMREGEGMQYRGGETITYTRDEVIHMYMAMQDRLNAAALIHGNRLPEETAHALIDQLTPEQKAWGDWMIESFGGDNFDRIQAVLIETENRAAGKVQRYFPMLRQDYTTQEFADEVADSILRTSWASRAGVQKKFTLERQEIAARNQMPIRLGATRIWRDQVAKQEKYIADARLVSRLRSIFGNRLTRAAMAQEFGQTALEVVDRYVTHYTNPNIYKLQDGASRISQVLRSNFAVSKLAFNVVTIGKQLPSVALYLAEVGPGALAASAAEFARNPGEMIRMVRELDPQVKNLVYSRFAEEIKGMDATTYERAVKRVGDVGFKGIFMMDTVARTIGWNAVYQSKIAQGLSQEEAVKAAQTATLRTQPAARAKDVADIYRSSEGFNWFLMFSNQLNQIFNLATADAYMAAKRGDAATVFGIYAGLAASGIGIGLLNRRRPQGTGEDDALPEIAADVAAQLISSVPLVGGSIVSGLSGWRGRGVDPLPIANDAGALLRSLSRGEFDNRDARALLRAIDSAASLAGWPEVAGRRLRRAMFDDDFRLQRFDAAELLGGGPAP